VTAVTSVDAARDREAAILDAVIGVLAREGIGGVSMRAVARAAGVSLGLANYYFSNKTSLICAALHRIGEQDLEILRTDEEDEPAERLRRALRRVAGEDFLHRDYLASRLQLWSLATVDAMYGEINRAAQQRYVDRLAQLLAAAMPGLGDEEITRRAGEILVVQNGIWLTAAIIDDSDALRRSVERCEAIAFTTTVPSP
jgi:AcrR family transcriptional regulator